MKTSSHDVIEVDEFVRSLYRSKYDTLFLQHDHYELICQILFLSTLEIDSLKKQQVMNQMRRCVSIIDDYCR
jgi:hypothetical protein